MTSNLDLGHLDAIISVVSNSTKSQSKAVFA